MNKQAVRLACLSRGGASVRSTVTRLPLAYPLSGILQIHSTANTSALSEFDASYSTSENNAIVRGKKSE